MIKVACLVLILSVSFFSQLQAGMIYEYVDKDGTVVLTDSPPTGVKAIPRQMSQDLKEDKKPATINKQSEGPPSIGQQLVREGTFAVKLVFALGIGMNEDEIEAESRLGEVGITPRNGWIADYPVTPDILGELQKAVSDAADAGKLSMNRDESLKRFNEVISDASLPVTPHAEGQSYGTETPGAENYPDPSEINNYYKDEGPPVVTYYVPPPDYYYLYAWVPYPFWCSGFWFPGFFVLHDFHRTIGVHGRVEFVSNHFNDINRHRVFRIDPLSRFNGRTFAGIGVSRTKGFLSTGVPGSARAIFHAQRGRMAPGSKVSQPARGGKAVSPHTGGGRTLSPPAGGSGGMRR
ncbi:MAG TPA: DUF4124 domain-containing protein [Syntrophales bacterium]|nr:DUF4124 domain-containing protein [Syntrophales bacterium]